MITHKAIVTIQKPQSQVFKYVATDYFQNHPKWDPRVVEMHAPNGPMAVGAKGTETRKQMGMKNIYDFKVTEYAPQKRFAFEATSRSTKYNMSFDFKARDGATELTLTAELNMAGFMRLIEWMIRGSFKKEIDKNAGSIKRMAESSG